MKINNVFAELKRRNVYKVAVAYAVVSWLLIQAASILFPTFEAPPWVMKVFICVLLLGFPLALAFSWAFELTPEGLKRESEVEPHESITVHTGRKIGVLTIALAVIAAGLLVFQLLRPKGAAPRSASDALRRDEHSEAVTTTTGPTSIPDKSVAVLPFQNLSDEKSNAYFAEGIQDEILTRLSKIASLKVISRSSTRKYATAPDNLRDVGKQLGVAHLLEGSVQKIANNVHVNVQLIRAATDEHIWAESYNRKLDDVFGVEGEVASAIAEQLNAQLSGAEEKAVTDKPTQNTAAYDAYLRGITTETRGTTEGYQGAMAAYSDAVQLDPKFAVAWARLALARSYLYFNGIDSTVNTGAAVKDAADRAIALQPDLGEGLLAQGVYRYRVLRDFPAALQSYTEALKRLPNSFLVLEQMAHLERRLGKTDSAEKHYEMAAALDPQNTEILATLADLYTSTRRFKEAEALYDRILQMSPANEEVIAQKAFMFQNQGRLDESATELSRAPADSKSDPVLLARVLQAYFERRFDAAISLLQTAPSPEVHDPRSVTLLGELQDSAGRKSESNATFLRAISIIKPSPDSVVPVDARQLPSYLAWAYAGLGEKEKALEQARAAVAAYKDDILAAPFAETMLAQVEARLGESDAALAALPHLLEETNGLTRGNLRVDPAWDPLRKDPRFAKLIAEPSGD